MALGTRAVDDPMRRRFQPPAVPQLQHVTEIDHKPALRAVRLAPASAVDVQLKPAWRIGRNDGQCVRIFVRVYPESRRIRGFRRLVQQRLVGHRRLKGCKNLSGARPMAWADVAISRALGLSISRL